MSNRNPNSRNNNWLVIIGGIVLILFTNAVVSVIVMYLLAFALDGSQLFINAGLYPVAIGLSAVWLYQLLYIIPVIISLKRQRKFSLMKGVIIGAVITALIAGFCFVQFIPYVIPSK